MDSLSLPLACGLGKSFPVACRLIWMEDLFEGKLSPAEIFLMQVKLRPIMTVLIFQMFVPSAIDRDAF